ncbi:MAG: HD domain-containing phosphohydrolase [Thermoanaerobaculia bacterium]
MSFFAQLKLRHFLFLLLVLSGLVPLVVSSSLLIRQNREIFETQEKSYLTRSARFLSVELNGYLLSTRRQLSQLGSMVMVAPSAEGEEEKLRQPWLVEYLQDFLASNPNLIAVRVLNEQGRGPYSASARLSQSLLSAMNDAFVAVREEPDAIYSFQVMGDAGDPVSILTVPIAPGADGSGLYVQGLTRLRQMETLFERESAGNVAVFLIDRDGSLLWAGAASEEMQQAVGESSLVQDFVAKPLNMTQEYPLAVGGKTVKMLGRVSPVTETGWGVVVHRPAKLAFAAVREMIVNTAVSTALLVTLALAVAIFAARKVSLPIQNLADTTHQIAAGNFGKRLQRIGPGKEIGDLAEDFNRMSGHVESYVDRLQDAAQQNRELFIGSMRSFVAAIDAKDPYTRGHSERVATYSRIITKSLGLSETEQHKIWVGALLHDVGKIGIEDRILTKGGVLSEEEYDQMKLHPVIGAQIMSRIEQLKEMIPAIRWHHEAWNGSGYPDGLKGEQIPLSARIVGVADSFDAITTNRPYQRAYEPDFAVETITRLAGTRFDAKVVTAFLQAFESGQIQKRTAPAPTAEEVRAVASS